MHLKHFLASILDGRQKSDIVTKHGNSNIRFDEIQYLCQTTFMFELLERIMNQLIEKGFSVVGLIVHIQIHTLNPPIQSKKRSASPLVCGHNGYFITMCCQIIGFVTQYTLHTTGIAGAGYAIYDSHYATCLTVEHSSSSAIESSATKNRA